MKKILAIALALVLCLSAVCFAEVVKSPSLVCVVDIISGNVPADAEVSVEELNNVFAYDVIEAQCAKYAAEGLAYFGDVEAIKAILGGDEAEYTLDEMIVLNAKGYDASYGDLELAMAFVTKYEAGEVVAVMFGMADGKDVTWTAIEGVANEEGNVVVTLTAEQLAYAAENIALVAVISK